MEQNRKTEPEQGKASVPLKNETWRLSVQMFVNIIIATIISAIVVLSLSSLMVGSLWGKVLVQVICMAITLPMIYGYMWGQGDRDSNFVQFGRMQPDLLKGLRAGLIGVIPTVVTCIPLALSMAGVLKFDFMPIYRILNAPMWGFINMIKPLGGAIPHAATEAIPATDSTPAIDAMPATDGLTWAAFTIIALLPLIYAAFSALGYYFGTKRLSVTSKLIYKDDKKRPNNRNRRRPY